jgi:hypothetical protein
MKHVDWLQIPHPTTGQLCAVEILGDSDGYYSRTEYPFEEEIMGPFTSPREVQEYLWALYGRS